MKARGNEAKWRFATFAELRPSLAKLFTCAALGMFLLGGVIVGPAPLWFACTCCSAVVASLLGKRWVRALATLILALSSFAAFDEFDTSSNAESPIRQAGRDNSER